MAAVYADQVTAGDRLSMTMCFAILLHALVVLGVTFVPEDYGKARYDTMEIILVQHRSEADPDQPDYLAQASQEGGGDSESDITPETPFTPPLPAPEAALAAPAPSETLSPLEAATDEVLTEAEAAPTAATPEAAEAVPSRPHPDTLVAKGAHAEMPLPEPEASPAPEAAEQPAATAPPREPAPLRPDAEQLISNSFAMASLSARIERRLQDSAKRPRRKFISANTKEFKFAAYMEAWRAKVERVGNLNYPDQARRQQLSGNLILEVILRPDGSVQDVIVRRSSGHRVLDDAATRIVELASPYAPFPSNIRQEVDLLHITRTWRFLNSYRLSSR